MHAVKFRNFLRIAPVCMVPPVSISLLDPCMGRERFGPVWAHTVLQEAVQGVVAFASEWDVKLRLVDVVRSRYQHL